MVKVEILLVEEFILERVKLRGAVLVLIVCLLEVYKKGIGIGHLIGMQRRMLGLSHLSFPSCSSSVAASLVPCLLALFAV